MNQIVAPEIITPWRLWWEFSRMGLSGFGGVLPFVRRSLVERNQWLNEKEFLELISIGQVLPGPNVVNLAVMFGWRVAGWRGALAAPLGLITLPLMLVLLLTMLYQQYAYLPAVRGAIHGMLAVTSGLIMATALKMLPAMSYRTTGLVLAAAAFVMVALLRWPLPLVLLGLGSFSLLLTVYLSKREVRQKQAQQETKPAEADQP